jgi:hypothetical protein
MNKEDKPAQRNRLQRGHRDLGNVLLEDEEVRLEATIHWGIYWKGTVLLVFALYLLLFVEGAYNLGIMFTGIAVIALILAWVTKYYLALVMTDRRTLARWGILHLDFVDMRYSQIESAEVSRSLMGRILGYGSVVLAGTGQRVVIVPYIGNAGEFRRALNEILLRREEKAD